VRKQVPAWSIPGSVFVQTILAAGLGLKLEPVSLSGEDIAFLQYTGGTTGVAKAAVLTHRTWWRTAAIAGLDQPALQAARPRRDHRICRCSIFLPDPAIASPSAMEPACVDHESADFPGFRGGAEEVQNSNFISG